eukprot:739168-Hanusia_phi.AAC.2
MYAPVVIPLRASRSRAIIARLPANPPPLHLVLPIAPSPPSSSYPQSSPVLSSFLLPHPSLILHSPLPLSCLPPPPSSLRLSP